MAFKDKRRGRWMVRWRTADGRHLQRSFVDRGDALRFESQVELDRPKYETLMDMTFKDLAGKFVEAHINVHIHEGARAEYRAAVDEQSRAATNDLKGSHSPETRPFATASGAALPLGNLPKPINKLINDL